MFRRRAALSTGAWSGATAQPSGKPITIALVLNDLTNPVSAPLRKGFEDAARDLGFTPVYLHYNSGLHVSTNGRALAQQLERLVAQWPRPLERLVLLGHSMGGLLARSALYYGTQAGHRWPARLDDLVFLGTPHHGAPLERAGHWVDLVLGATPYAAPFARLGQVRSAGITDLRHGNLMDGDWVDRKSVV